MGQNIPEIAEIQKEADAKKNYTEFEKIVDMMNNFAKRGEEASEDVIQKLSPIPIVGPIAAGGVAYVEGLTFRAVENATNRDRTFTEKMEKAVEITLDGLLAQAQAFGGILDVLQIGGIPKDVVNVLLEVRNQKKQIDIEPTPPEAMPAHPTLTNAVLDGLYGAFDQGAKVEKAPEPITGTADILKLIVTKPSLRNAAIQALEKSEILPQLGIDVLKIVSAEMNN